MSPPSAAGTKSPAINNLVSIGVASVTGIPGKGFNSPLRYISRLRIVSRPGFGLIDIIRDIPARADVAKLADAPDLGSGFERSGGSSPLIRTKSQFHGSANCSPDVGRSSGSFPDDGNVLLAFGGAGDRTQRDITSDKPREELSASNLCQRRSLCFSCDDITGVKNRQ